MNTLHPTDPEQGTLNRTARLSGALCLALAVLAPFSILYVPSQVLVPGDGAATLSRLIEQQGLFRAGMVVDALVVLIEVVLTVLLFRLFESVDRTISLMAAFARLAMTVLLAANLGLSLATLRLAESAQPALVLVASQAHGDFVIVWQFVFGLHCLLLAILVHRSGFLPKALGVLMFLAAAGYLSDSFGRFVWSAYSDHFGWVVGLLATVGELSFTLWLLIRGVSFARAPAAEHREIGPVQQAGWG